MFLTDFFFPSPHPYHDTNWWGRSSQIEGEHTNVLVIDLMCCFFTLWLTQFGETHIHWLFDPSDNLLYYCIKYVPAILNVFISFSFKELYAMQGGGGHTHSLFVNKYWYSQKKKNKTYQEPKTQMCLKPLPLSPYERLKPSPSLLSSSWSWLGVMVVVAIHAAYS